MALKDVHGLPQLKMPKIHSTATNSSLLSVISLENGAPPTKNGSSTATVTIKPEYLEHHWVEQDLFYP